MIKLYAFRWVPPFARGLVRDLRVRWALEELGQPYEEILIGAEEKRSEAYRRLQPFGQVPAIEEDGLVLFESGAIVLHLAERAGALMPEHPAARARAKAWMFAALSSVEPSLFHFVQKPDETERRALAKARLDALAAWLGERDYLEDSFTAGDLLMTTVLRIARSTDLLSEYPTLDAYRLRCEARPAFARALEAQLLPFAANEPA